MADQRPVPSKVFNHDEAPLVLKQVKMTLVETYSSPTQNASPDQAARRSTVKYANRAGMQASTFVLDGQVVCQNVSSKPVEALGLTVVLFDAFHQPLQAAGQAQAATTQVRLDIPAKQTKTISWQAPMRSEDLYEAAVVITRIRFTDGTTWIAPADEVTDIF